MIFTFTHMENTLNFLNMIFTFTHMENTLNFLETHLIAISFSTSLLLGANILKCMHLHCRKSKIPLTQYEEHQYINNK